MLNDCRFIKSPAATTPVGWAFLPVQPRDGQGCPSYLSIPLQRAPPCAPPSGRLPAHLHRQAASTAECNSCSFH